MKTEHGDLAYMSGFDKLGYGLLENTACAYRGRGVPRRRLCGEEEVEITGTKAEDYIPIQFTEILPDEGYVVFPNPSEGKFSLLSEGEVFGQGCSIELYDMLGRLCYQQSLPAGKLRADFDVIQLQAGNYILRLKNQDSEVFRTKINIYPR